MVWFSLCPTCKVRNEGEGEVWFCPACKMRRGGGGGGWYDTTAVTEASCLLAWNVVC